MTAMFTGYARCPLCLLFFDERERVAVRVLQIEIVLSITLESGVLLSHSLASLSMGYCEENKHQSESSELKWLLSFAVLPLQV